MTIKIQVVNPIFNKSTIYKTNVRPFIGDALPIHYINEVVTKVLFNTPLSSEKGIPSDIDLIVYTK